jgi:hypothetical protein
LKILVIFFTKYDYDYQIKEDELGGNAARMGEMRIHEEPESNRPLGRPRCRCENNIKIDRLLKKA